MEGRVRRYREPVVKPCPFCGRVPIIHKHFKDIAWSLSHECSVVGLINIDWQTNRTFLIRKWNTRNDGDSC